MHTSKGPSCISLRRVWLSAASLERPIGHGVQMLEEFRWQRLVENIVLTAAIILFSLVFFLRLKKQKMYTNSTRKVGRNNTATKIQANWTTSLITLSALLFIVLPNILNLLHIVGFFDPSA